MAHGNNYLQLSQIVNTDQFPYVSALFRRNNVDTYVCIYTRTNFKTMHGYSAKFLQSRLQATCKL